MSDTIRFVVPALPVAQPRQRFRNIKTKDGREFTQNYTPRTGKAASFKATVRLSAQQAYQGAPLTGPLQIDIKFVFARESSKVWKTRAMPRYRHTQKPDRDNLDKSVLDAMKGTLFVDDSQVCAGSIEKWRAAGDEQPHCEITITQLEPV